MDIIDEIYNLGLPLDEIIVVGSGIMVQAGLKGYADIDLVASESLYERLKHSGEWTIKQFENGEEYLARGNVEILQSWDSKNDSPNFTELRHDSINIQSVSFIKLERLLAWKTKLNREVDKEDIKILKRTVDPANINSMQE